MAILLPHLNIAYYPMPKTACTSLKHAIFAINNGFSLKSTTQKLKKRKKKRCQIHAIYQTEQFIPREQSSYRGYTKIAVIRDPIERIVSAYSNRILYHRALRDQKTVQKLKIRSLPLEPSLNDFALNIDSYRDSSHQVMSHTRPFEFYLGKDLKFFDRIFRLKEMHLLEDFLSERAGYTIKIPRLQTGGEKQDLSSLSEESFASLVRYCLLDYELVDNYFDRPTWSGGAARWKS